MGPSPAMTEPTGSSSSPRASSRRSRHPDTNSTSCEAPQGRPRQGTPSPPRPRLSTEGLGRKRVLRIARGPSREVSARSPISVSREAPFSVSLEAGSPAVRRPPPRPTLPTAGHVPFNASNHHRDLSRTAAQHHKKTDVTRSRISTIPAGAGHGGDYRPLCPATVTTISAWDRVWWGLLATVSYHCVHDQPPVQGLGAVHQSLGTVHQGLGNVGVRACRDLGVQRRDLERAADRGHSGRTQWPVTPAISCPWR